ncbi:MULTISPECIES: ATP-binding protein [Leptospira]|uniref:ATP-binding protein n=1 Tax=Leptospira TaxID=171 RepID=UPI0004750665|nr:MULTISPECIES: ATP-binding protein [Leptospira]KGE21132.1 histidine kinase [Leptospira borgpetersenii serovar Ballum]MBE8162127.1 ABC transporter substrate-binding protein [Leptospira borgpetersenii serovar Ballum]MBE8166505.1 ABC transporter substrate-binding protein [Leptospira borgpetersenii serovar Ballum]MBE8171876.1 ABC transporter substrate-binding protein [Leptospira borgpetersenii serovar Ballum]MBE8175128.1 ABC transporter substrate-binding protein [Leptospira borgpetersenii serova
MSSVIEIAITSRISAFPILYAKSRGFFEKEGIQVQIRVLENYDAILAFLSSGKIEVGEIPFTTWLDLHLKKTVPNKSIFRGMILSRMIHSFYSKYNSSMDSILEGTPYLIPVLQNTSVDKLLAQEFMRSSRFRKKISYTFVYSRSYLLEYEFAQTTTLGLIGSVQESHFLNNGFRISEGRDLPPYRLPVNMLAFNGRFAKTYPDRINKLQSALFRAIQSLIENTSDTTEHVIQENIPEFKIEPEQLHYFYKQPSQDLQEILSPVAALEELEYLGRIYWRSIKHLTDPPPVLLEALDLAAKDPIPIYPAALKTKKTVLMEEQFNREDESNRLLEITGDRRELGDLVSDVHNLVLNIYNSKKGVRLPVLPLKGTASAIRTGINSILDFLFQEIRTQEIKALAIDNVLMMQGLEMDKRNMELQFSDDRFNYLFEFSPIPVILLDSVSGALIAGNYNFRSLTSYSKDNIHSLRLEDLFPGLEEMGDWSSPTKSPETMLRVDQVKMKLRDKSEMDVSLSITALFERARKIYQVHILYDSEKKETEQAKHEFISNISHELRSPMTNIQGYFELLRAEINTFLSKDQSGMLNVIEKNIKRLNHLIENLLKFEEVQGEDNSGLVENFDPALVIEEVVYSNEPSAKEKGLGVELNLIKKLKVRGIRFEFSQVITNLFVNAIKYTEKGKIEMTMIESGEGTIEINIKDTGVGIDPKYVEKVFERFFRVPNDRNKRVGGTGLGLPISRTILHKMNGEITLESRVGGGSNFKISLPLQSSDSK